MTMADGRPPTLTPWPTAPPLRATGTDGPGLSGHPSGGGTLESHGLSHVGQGDRRLQRQALGDEFGQARAPNDPGRRTPPGGHGDAGGP